VSQRWLDIFDRIQAETTARVSAVSAGQLDGPTPCTGWTVRTLLNHLIEINLQYAAIAGGTEPIADGLDHAGSDHVAAYTAAAGIARAAFARPGMLEQIYDFPWGADPGWTIVRHVCNELLIHTWDLSRATGQSTDLVPDYAPESLAIWQAWFASMGDGARPEGGAFAPERTAPAGSPPADHLAAYLGREV
jgi:uncharacterized protein (TIGR03086 family)